MRRGIRAPVRAQAGRLEGCDSSVLGCGYAGARIRLVWHYKVPGAGPIAGFYWDDSGSLAERLHGALTGRQPVTILNVLTRLVGS